MNGPIAKDYELVDPLGNRLTVEPLNAGHVIIRIVQDDGGVDGDAAPQDAHVIVSRRELHLLAGALGQLS